MAGIVLVASYFNLTGPGNIHQAMNKIELATECEEKDVTTFTSLGWKENTGGLKSGSVAFTVNNDYADDALDEDMWTIYLAGVPIAFEARYSQAAVGPSNPKYTGLILPKTWIPISGSVGDVAQSAVTWPTSGAWTRGVA